MTGLAYTDARGRIFFDETRTPLADGGIERAALTEELIPAPPGTVTTMLPGRAPLLHGGKPGGRRTALAALLPAGYTRLLLPAYRSRPGAPALPLFGYTFAAVVDDELHVAAMRTDESEDWTPRYFAPGELERAIDRRHGGRPGEPDPGASRALLARVRLLHRAERLPRTRRGGAAGVAQVQRRLRGLHLRARARRRHALAADAHRVRVRRRGRRADRDPSPGARARGIVSFGQGCEGEPLLRVTTIERAIERIRAQRPNGTINLNTNGSLPKSLARLIDAGLQAVRISLNSFRKDAYAAYYRPTGYDLDDVLESIALAVARGLRVSLNYLTHPGVTDERAEVETLERFLSAHRVAMVQTRTLNIDPERYFASVGRPGEPLGMREALLRIERLGIPLGNFTHTH